ncbi:MAG: ribosome biosis GTPase / thiamine phosphate phosphatase, partial [Frankiaceae bacterium]|nr:ribosome biosis GTPase / thiamine phosphate phosphatase [Frankiaceae bacterium]
MTSSALHQLGWSDLRSAEFQQYAAAGFVPARVVRPERGACVVTSDTGTTTAVLRLDLCAGSTAVGQPTVGDWVACSPDDGAGLAIRAVLARTSAFVRHAAGNETAAHALAANVDVVFVVVPLNRKINLTRIERFLTLAWESGATPVLVLSKADVCADVAAAIDGAAAAAPGVDVLAVSAAVGDGVPELARYAVPGGTVALLGQSGAGKSTLVNALAGAPLMETRDIRADGRGRHTTTHRELVVLPAGGILIDTPGLRTLLLWDADDGLERAFEDVEGYAAQCRFHDCAHQSEPGCAVTEAVRSGELPQRRVD